MVVVVMVVMTMTTMIMITDTDPIWSKSQTRWKRRKWARWW